MIRRQEELVIITKVAKAHGKSESVRTTIPEEVVKALGCKPGDALAWEIDSKTKKATIKKIE
jgi:DNA-binding Xre family transcriptional regulator